MKRFAVLALVLAGCEQEETEWFPIEPGGGGGTGGSTKPDAAIGDGGGDASATITGRVCLLAGNLRTVSSASCATTGADNLTVTLGSATTMTAVDGAFSLMRPASTAGLYWNVSGAGIETALVAYGAKFGTAATPLLPAFDTIAYQGMVTDNQAVYTQDSAGIIVQVRKGSAIVSSAIVSSTPAADSEIYYDGANDALWNTGGNGTGAYGVAWIPSIAGSSAQLTVTSNATPTMFTGIPLTPGAITFLTAEIP